MQNTYDNFIKNIIKERGQWNIPEGVYYEAHHIVPCCLGGLPKRDVKCRLKHPNIIYLYPEEHFEAHRLLAEQYPDILKIQAAFNIMLNKTLKYLKEDVKIVNDNLNDIVAKNYEKYRKAYANLLKKQGGCKTTLGTKSVYNDKTNEKRYIKISEVDEFLKNNPDFKLGSCPQRPEDMKKRKSIAGVNNGMYGKHLSTEAKEKKSLKGKQKRWYTNGTDDIFINVFDDVPAGYYKGRSKIDTKGFKNGMFGKTNSKAKKVIEINSGKIFDSVAKASKYLCISTPIIRRSLCENKEVYNKHGKKFCFKSYQDL